MSTESKLVAQFALPILKELKERDRAYYEERNEMYRRAAKDRTFDWQSYCRHGSYIGDPFGGDYLCGVCEDGASVYEEAIAEAWAQYRRWREAAPHLQALVNLGVITRDQAFDYSMQLAPKY